MLTSLDSDFTKLGISIVGAVGIEPTTSPAKSALVVERVSWVGHVLCFKQF